MDSVIIFRKLYEKPLVIISLIVAAATVSLHLGLPHLDLPGFIQGSLTFLVQLFLPLSTMALIAALLLNISDYFNKGPEIIKRYGITPLPHYEPLARTRMPKQLKKTIAENRAVEVAKAEEFVKSDARLLVISGDRGIGKSTLAAFIARRVDFWLNLEGKDVELPYLVHQLAQWQGQEELRRSAINLGKISQYEINALVETIHRSDSRIFLNSFGTLINEKGNFLDKQVKALFDTLLDSEGKAKIVLIASQVPKCLEGYLKDGRGVNIHLEGLSVDAGAKLLEDKYSSEDGHDWFREIAKAVEGNPLLLRIVPPVLSDDDSVEIIRCKQWKNSDDPSSLNLEFLKRAAAEGLPLLQKIAFIPEPVTESFISALAEADSMSKEIVEELKNKSLIEWDGGMKKCYLHPMITASAFASLEDDKEEYQRVREQVTTVCIKKAEDFKHPSRWTSVSDCRLYLHAIDFMLENGRLDESMDLLLRIHPYVMKWGNLRLLNNFYTRLIDLWKGSNAKLNEQQQTLLIKVLLNLAKTELAGRGQKSAIYPAHALLQLSKARKHLDGRIASTSLLARLYQDQGNHSEAVKYSRSYLKAVKEKGDRALYAKALTKSGSTLVKAKVFGQAEAMFSRAIKLFREQEDVAGQSSALEGLAELYGDAGYHQEALNLLQDKIDLAKSINDDKARLAGMKSMGEVHMQSGNIDQAMAILDGLAIEATEKEYWYIASDCLKAMANISIQQKDFAASVLRGQKRLEIALKIEDKEMEASARAIIGIAYAKSREFSNAMESYIKARDLYLGLNMIRQAYRCYYYVSRLYAVKEQWETASDSIIETARLNLEVSKSIGSDIVKLMIICRARVGEELFDPQAESALGVKVFNSILQSVAA
jgi:tetratricopeptide (TPR) repeat protein